MFSLPDKATVDLLFSFLPTFNTVVVSPSLALSETVPEPVLANRYVFLEQTNRHLDSWYSSNMYRCVCVWTRNADVIIKCISVSSLSEQ